MLETSEEGDTEVVKTAGLVRVTVRNDVNSCPLPRKGVLQVVELAEALETSEEGVAEVVKKAGLVKVTIRSAVKSISEPRYPLIQVCLIPKTNTERLLELCNRMLQILFLAVLSATRESAAAFVRCVF